MKKIYSQLPKNAREYRDTQPLKTRGTCCLCGGCLDLRANVYRYISGQFAHTECAHELALKNARNAQLSWLE